ncbi:hypothetical protein CesoFtcFv8_011669 [Champsocephalus esox]|uniref:Uncharacterized protein n=2 Tax=Champsocephalus TaxID=52236 RepID=A0AAN8HPY8_CHAGU|nr:hypothetical protein CesoFtcFv8_011669 [Champsocephalus esox]KAK5924066.1 hypothetical protein CgunFtcFv8_000974 [Champsocephalus gunnari]
MRGSFLAVRSEPLQDRVLGSELRDLLGRTMSALQLRQLISVLPMAPYTCSAAEKSAPSPTLHYDKSRQAGRQLCH